MHDRDVKWSKIAILKEIADRALFHGEGRAYREDPRFAVLVPPKLPSGDRARRLLVFLDADAAVSNFERTFEWQALHREVLEQEGSVSWWILPARTPLGCLQVQLVRSMQSHAQQCYSIKTSMTLKGMATVFDPTSKVNKSVAAAQ